MKEGTFTFSLMNIDNKLPIEEQKEHTPSQNYYKLKENLENYQKKLNEKNNGILICHEKNNNFNDDTLNRAILQIEKFNQILNELKKMGIHF